MLAGEARKYVNTRETEVYSKSRVLFALDLARSAIEERGHAVLMEGQFDVIVAHEHGVSHALAASGTALTADQVRLLRRYTDQLVLMFDNDPAGRQATYRAIELAASHGLHVRVVRTLGTAQDPDEFFRAGGRWDEALAAARPGWEHWVRSELEGLSPSRPSDVEVAVGRLHRVLERIRDPAVRDSYRRDAAVWFGINPALLTAQRGAWAAKQQRGGDGATAKVAANESPGNVSRGSVSPPSAPSRLTLRVGYLLSILSVRPDAARLAAEQLVLDDLEAEERDAITRMLDALNDGGLDGLRRRLPEFPSEDQNLVRRAWAAAPPRCDDELVLDLVQRIANEAAARRRSAIIGRLLEAERRGDTAEADALNQELAQRNAGGRLKGLETRVG